MKKLLFGLSALVALVATSCQQASDELNVVGCGDATVTFAIDAPIMKNRVFSDGLTAKRLQYAVYAVSGENAEKKLRLLSDLTNETTLDNNKRASIDLKLTTGNTYSVVFWADQYNNPHYEVKFDTDKATMEVLDYATAVCNDETRDAFFAVYEFTVSGSQTETIYLKRPFAQLNIGANDFLHSEKAGHKVTHAKVSVKSYRTLDLVSGEATNQEVVDFAYAAIPDAKVETFPIADNDYLAMNYVLMNNRKEVMDQVTFYYATGLDASGNGLNEKSRVVGSVPFQRNHRTNLYGQLFTGNVTINVEVKPDYDDDPNNILLPTLVGVTNVESFTAALNDANVKEIGLSEDLVLSSAYTLNNRDLTINGNGHTISFDNSNRANIIALFDVNGGSITLNNVKFDGVEGGAIIRTVGADAIFENVTVENCNHTMIQGMFRLLGNSTIKNCTFKNNTCSMVVSLNYDADDTDYIEVIENSLFEGNTCSDTAVIYYVNGAHATVDNCKFEGNKVSCAANCATLYMGWNESVVTNNMFKNNSVTTTHATSKRVTGGLMVGNAGTYTNNAFIGNTVTSPVAGLGNNAYAGTYYASIDLSGNYWGGAAPVEGVDYYNEYATTNPLVINDYLTTYEE